MPVKIVVSHLGGSWEDFLILDADNAKLLPLYTSNIYYMFYVKEVVGVYNIYEIHSFDGGIVWTSEVLLFSNVANSVIDAICEVSTLTVLVTYIKNVNEVTVSKSYDGCVTWVTPEVIGTV